MISIRSEKPAVLVTPSSVNVDRQNQTLDPCVNCKLKLGCDIFCYPCLLNSSVSASVGVRHPKHLRGGLFNRLDYRHQTHADNDRSIQLEAPAKRVWQRKSRSTTHIAKADLTHEIGHDDPDQNGGN